MAKKESTQRGRPSLCTPEITAKICDRLAKGETLVQICRDEGIDYSTVRRWENDKEEFRALSMRAREIGCHAIADDCISIADDGTNDYMETRGPDGETAYKLNGENVQRSRLRIETRMRLLGKWLPKVYGERMALDADVTITKKLADMTDEELLLIATKKIKKND